MGPTSVGSRPGHSDVLNAFNDDANEGVESQLGTAENFGKPSAFIAPRRLVVGAKLVF